MKFFDTLLGTSTTKKGEPADVRKGASASVRPHRGRLEATQVPQSSDAANSKSMTFRAVFEMVTSEVLKDLRLTSRQAEVQVLRVRGNEDPADPKYVIVIVAHVKELINLPVMVEFEKLFSRQLAIISPAAGTALLGNGISWQISKKVSIDDRLASPEQFAAARRPGQAQPAATDYGGL